MSKCSNRWGNEHQVTKVQATLRDLRRGSDAGSNGSRYYLHHLPKLYLKLQAANQKSGRWGCCRRSKVFGRRLLLAHCQCLHTLSEEYVDVLWLRSFEAFPQLTFIPANPNYQYLESKPVRRTPSAFSDSQ